MYCMDIAQIVYSSMMGFDKVTAFGTGFRQIFLSKFLSEMNGLSGS